MGSKQEQFWVSPLPERCEAGTVLGLAGSGEAEIRFVFGYRRIRRGQSWIVFGSVGFRKGAKQERFRVYPVPERGEAGSVSGLSGRIRSKQDQFQAVRFRTGVKQEQFWVSPVPQRSKLNLLWVSPVPDRSKLDQFRVSPVPERVEAGSVLRFAGTSNLIVPLVDLLHRFCLVHP